jgi:hypothetical protein
VFDDMEAARRLLSRDWALYDAHHVVYEPLLLTPEELQRETQRATSRFYSLGNALRSAARFDFFDVGLKLYAWRAARRLHRGKVRFLDTLREEVLRGARVLQQMLPQRPTEIALPTLGIPEAERRFLLEFLRRLGVRTLEVPVPASRFLDHVSALPERVHVVLLPFLAEVQKQAEGLQRLGWVWAARTEGHSFLGLSLEKTQLYRACIELGLGFDRSFRRVRRAYQHAVEAAALSELAPNPGTGR